MTWLLTALVLIGVIGPVFWLLPSKRQRQVGRLRAAARRAGLVVELARLPKIDARAHERVTAAGVAKEPVTACVAYRLPLLEPAPAAPAWRLHRTGADDGPVAGWTLQDDAAPATTPACYWRRVGAVANDLPGGCLAVEADAAHVAWYGTEHCADLFPDAVATAIHAGLTALAALQCEAGER